MNSTRLKALAKLGLLLGIPLTIVLGLFSYGVKVGVDNRVGILSFERDWLGIDVEVPGDESPDSKAGESGPDASPEGKVPAKADPAKAPTKAADPAKAPTKAADPTTTPGADTKTPVEPTPKPDPETTPAPHVGPARSPFTLARLAAVPAEVEPALREKRIVRVKVLVDRAIILGGGDWISDVQNSVRWSSEVLDAQVGVQLELVGVVAWQANTLDMSGAQLQQDLESHARDGADVVVGFTNRSLRLAPKDASPVIPSDALRTVSVAYSESGSSAPRVHGLLLAIGEVFGARPILSTSDPEALAGSWMSVDALRAGRALYLDPANRLRIIGNKKLEFNKAAGAAPAVSPMPTAPSPIDVSPESDVEEGGEDGGV